MIGISSFQKYGLVVCSETNENCSNSSRFCHQSQKNSKATSDISMKFIEKFTELTLENSDDVKSAGEEVDKHTSETIAVDCSEKCINQRVLRCDNKCSTNDPCDRLPVAKISIKENGRESVCLNCNKGTFSCTNQELNEIKNANKKNWNLSLTQLLIPRSPVRTGRKHCKEVSSSFTKGCSKYSAKQQQNNTCDENIFNLSIESPPSQQQLHGSGGSCNETNLFTSLYDINKDFYIESVVTPPESFTDSLCEQLSPVSLDYLSSSIANNVGSSSGSTEIFLPSVSKSSPASHDCLSQSIDNNDEPRDTKQPLPGILEIYPTPPHSAFENALPFRNNILSYASEYVNDPLLDISWPISELSNDSLTSQSLEEILTTDVSSVPLSEKSSELDKLSPSSHTHDEEIKRINCYLKNGDVNPLIAQLVTNYSECLGKTKNEKSGYHSTSANGQSNKLCSVQQSLFNNEQTKQLPVATELPSNTTSFQPCTTAAVPTYSVSNIENQLQSSNNNVTSSTVLLLPIQYQTIAVSELKNKRHQRELKPKHCPAVSSESALSKNKKREQVKRVDYNRRQMLSETSRTNSVYHGGHKSVKEKIRSSMSREQKNQSLKLALEEQSTAESETKLHSAVLSGDETLVYAIIESWRAKIKTDHLNSKIDSAPRISLNEAIQKFVNVQNSYGCTPLYYATLGNNNLLTAYLLECGADPYIKDNKDGNTPFHIATIKGDDSLVLMELLSYNRSIGDISNIRNNKGQTVLISAVINHGKKYNEIQRNGIKLIKYLLETNHKLSEQDVEGRTALHIAVLKKDLDLLKVLLTFATDGDAKFVLDNEGNTILHLAATLTNIRAETHYNLIRMIILHCSKLTEISNNMGKVPYQLINENRKEERDLLKMKMDEYGFRNL